MPKHIYHLKTVIGKPSAINYQAELNAEQLRVVSGADGHCLVLAGAGSGKTRTLVYRVAYLLEHGIKPEHILLMTFTNKAAKEMLWRVEQLLGYKPQGLWGGTFHHIGNRILRQHIKKLGYNQNYTILDEEDAQDVLKGIIGDRNLQKKKYFPKAGVIKNIISFTNNARRSLAQTFRQNFSYLDERILPLISDIADGYQQKKKSLNALDYDDLLLLWLELLETNQAVREQLAKKFQYILVDEYQDTNHLQARIVEALGEHHGNVLVVGDDAQSIYSFRAAEVANILNFPKKLTDVHIFKLESNYRSTPQILALANESIRHNQDQFEKKLIPIKPNGEKPALIPVQNNEQQAEFICQRIIELTEEGFDLCDIAVLFRADYQALELELTLNKMSIPYIKRGGVKFFEQAHLKDIIAFLRISHNPQDQISWTRVLNLQNGIGRVGAQKIIHGLSGDDLLSITKAKFELPPLLTKAWEELSKVIAQLADRPADDVGGLIQSILENFYEAYADVTFENALKRIEDIEQLISFAANYHSLEEFLSDVSLSENFRTSGIAETETQRDDYLLLSTVHQAKGLEWPVVFILGLTSGQFPHAKAMNSSQELEEERRLFYVAVTRAQRQLYLLYPLVNYNHTYGFIFAQPSEFIRELDQNLYDQWQVDSDSAGDLPTIKYGKDE